MRSLLFIPGDSPKKLDKGIGSGADAIIVDLEDAISPERKASARDDIDAAAGSKWHDQPDRLDRIILRRARGGKREQQAKRCQHDSAHVSLAIISAAS